MSKSDVKIKLAAAALAGTLLLSGCGEAKPPVAYIEAPPEGADNFFDISYDEWHNEYSYQLLRGNYTEEANADVAKDYRQSTIDYLVQERTVLWLAREMGISAETLTQEETDEINKSTEETLEGWYQSYESDAKEQLGSEYTDEQLKDKEKELFAQFLSKADLTEDIFYKWAVNEAITQKFVDAVSADITDETIEDFVQETIDTAKDKYENDIAAYEQSYTPFYIPEGTRIVQQIYVKLKDAVTDEITAYRKDGDDEKADEILQKELEKIKFRIDEAYEKLENGTDWADVLEEYSEEGAVDYTVYPKSSVVDPTITEAVMNIPKKGEWSDIISTDAGYFILYYKDDRAMTDEEMQALRDQARDYLKDQAAYGKVSEFTKAHPYSYDYEQLQLEEPQES